MKTILCFVASVVFGLMAHAQIQPCSTSSIMNRLHELQPELLQQRQQYRAHIQSLMHLAKSGDSLDTIVYTIPVVFHIIHEYGDENISDQQIYDQMRVLNEDYMNLNTDTFEVTPFFDTTVGVARMQFKLASLDPLGLPTNGITRRYIHESYSTQTDNYDFTKYDRWPRSSYLNVWVVDNMSLMANGGTAGYAYHPSDVEGTASFIDGVIILDSYIGSIGTSSPHNSRSLTHEIGHYLGLDHVWGPSNEPAVIGNCGKDDGIEDTPNCQGSEVDSCDLSRSTCDTLPDPVQNYMDYSYCSVMFSEDQVSFMRNVLREATAQRNNLWTATNLSKTIPEGIVYDPVADFYVKNADITAENQNNPFTCIGNAVTFTNASWRLVGTNTTYSWKFEDATPSTSTAENPSVTFNSQGWKDVTLTITNNGRSNTIVKHNFIYVSQNWPAFNGKHQFNFEDHPDWWVIWNPMHNVYQWKVQNGAGTNGSNGIFLDMTNPYTDIILNSPEYFFGVRRAGSRSSFITVPMDFSYMTNSTISFDYACATNATEASEITEKLAVFVSYDCGQSWIPVGNSLQSKIEGSDLVNNGNGWQSFIPDGTSTWTHKTINISPVINGKNHVQFKFVYYGTATSNNIAIDNIAIDGTLSVEAPSELDHISVYPNPTSSSEGWSITYANEWSGAKVKLLDMSGRIVSEGTLPENQTTWNLVPNNAITKGVYLLKIQTNTGSTQKKLIIR